MLRNAQDSKKRSFSLTSVVYLIGIALLVVFAWMAVNTLFAPDQNVALAGSIMQDAPEQVVIIICKGVCDDVPVPETGGGDDDDPFECIEPNPDVEGNTGTTFMVMTDAQIYFGPNLESGTGINLPAGDTFYILNNPAEADGWILWSYHGCLGSRWLAPGTPVTVAG